MLASRFVASRVWCAHRSPAVFSLRCATHVASASPARPHAGHMLAFLQTRRAPGLPSRRSWLPFGVTIDFASALGLSSMRCFSHTISWVPFGFCRLAVLCRFLMADSATWLAPRSGPQGPDLRETFGFLPGTLAGAEQALGIHSGMSFIAISCLRCALLCIIAQPRRRLLGARRPPCRISPARARGFASRCPSR